MLFQAAHLESRQLQYEKARQRIADRAAQASLQEEMPKCKQSANEKHQGIGSLEASHTELDEQISQLSAKKAALLAELKNVEAALDAANQEKAQLPNAIKNLQ